MTSEAQQALLKLFEEPQAGVIFVFLLPHGSLLPTLRSRMLEYPEKLAPEESNSGEGDNNFLHATPKDAQCINCRAFEDEEERRESAYAIPSCNGSKSELSEASLKIRRRAQGLRI